ncbi:MAG: transcriptional regulator [Propionibacteriaceae bacterium]|nr:transcriptional regulator [Micropruina sp.]HBX79909.1 MarR family transcriptional regulator [Propionibacteriaceae bacterium]
MTLPAFDETIHNPVRLRICAMLAGLDVAGFPVIRGVLGVSDSVLSKHLAMLEAAGYVKLSKATSKGRLRTSVSLTPTGRAAYFAHVAELRRIVDQAPQALE